VKTENIILTGVPAVNAYPPYFLCNHELVSTCACGANFHCVKGCGFGGGCSPCDCSRDLSESLMKDKVFMESVERARAELRDGEDILTQEEVFGAE